MPCGGRKGAPINVLKLTWTLGGGDIQMFQEPGVNQREETLNVP
jgi:hypothetical protein